MRFLATEDDQIELDYPDLPLPRLQNKACFDFPDSLRGRLLGNSAKVELVCRWRRIGIQAEGVVTVHSAPSYSEVHPQLR